MPNPLLSIDSAESAAYAATESLRRGVGPIKRGWRAPDRFRIEFPAVLPAPTFDPAIAAPVLMQAMPQ